MTPAEALEHAAARLERSLERLSAWRADGLLPNVTEGGRWELLSPLVTEGAALTGLPWTGGFVPGQLWLASRLPGRERLAEEAAAMTELLAPRAAQPNTHDLGFLFWPSAIVGSLATGEPRYRDLALQAARSLVQRALPSGVIQVIGPLDDPEYRGRAIVDTHPNLLLLWYAGEHEAALRHLEIAGRGLERPDGSTFHAARFADDGSVLEHGTINGYGAGSTWARGQAWAIHGLVSAYRVTRRRDLLDRAERAVRWFLDHLPADAIPPWDFDAPPDGPRDASAGAIAASALLDLPGRRDDGLRLLDALIATCLNRGDADGLLLHCCYRYPLRKAIDSATAWGDFFLLDALVNAAAPDLRLDPLARRHAHA